MPIPKDAPSELPRMVFTSPDKKWSLNISPERTNLFFNISPTSIKEEIGASKFSSIASEFFSNYQEELKLRVQCTAFVTERSTIPR